MNQEHNRPTGASDKCSVHKTLCVEVIEEGDGIPAERMPKLGEELHYKRKWEQVLTVSRKNSFAQKGSLKLASQVDKGTMITMTLLYSKALMYELVPQLQGIP